MRKLVYVLICFSLLLGACQKENVDEIVIEDIPFEPDTTIELSGFLKASMDGKVISDQIGYTFICKVAHDNIDFYKASNSLESTLTFGDPTLSEASENYFEISWYQTSESARISAIQIPSIRDQNNGIIYEYLEPIKGETSISITENSNNFIKGKFEGNFRIFGTTTTDSIFFLSGAFELPLYDNCERSLPIGEGNSIVFLPYLPPFKSTPNHIVCIETGAIRHLISNVPISFEQYFQDSNSILQNENDFYAYWVDKKDSPSPTIVEFDFRIKLKVFDQVKVYQSFSPIVQTYDGALHYEYDELQNQLKNVSVLGSLREENGERSIGGFALHMDEVTTTQYPSTACN